MRSLIQGALAPWKAFQLIVKNPPLRRACLFPFAIAGLTIPLYILAFRHLSSFLASYMGQKGWPSLIQSGANFLLQIGVWVLCAYLFSSFLNLVLCPLNDFLSEATQKVLTNHPIAKVTTKQQVNRLKMDFQRTLVCMLIAYISLFFSFFGMLSPLAFFLNALAIAFQYLSFPQLRRDEKLGESLNFLKDYFWESLGFGGIFCVLFSIPLIAPFFIPLAVVGGSRLYFQKKG